MCRCPAANDWRQRGGVVLASALSVLALGAPLTAGDWPQVLGPQRNGQAVGESLPEQFPQGQLTPKFTYALGAGFAGPAVVGDQVLVFHRVEDQELLESLDARTGKRVWSATFPAEHEGTYSSDTGPRCVPLVHGDRVYVFGASGRAHCVALKDGRAIWSRALAKDYGAPEGFFGIGASPIVAGDKLLVHLGGKDGSGIVALELATGKTVWKASQEAVSYASPIRAELHGQPYYLFMGRLHALLIDANTGAERLRHPFGRLGPTVTGATPVIFGNRIFLTASYGIGAEVIEVDAKGKVRSLWANDDTLSSQYAASIYLDGYLYGTHGREDGPPSDLRCVEAATGRVLWSEPDVGVANLIAAGNRLLVTRVQYGEVLLVDATPDKYRELDRRKASDDVLRALPALADGTLYLRASNEQTNRGLLLALPIFDPPGAAR